MPGATLTHASRRSRPSTNGQGGVHSSTWNVRPRPPRRAGSANATSKGDGVDAWSRRPRGRHRRAPGRRGWPAPPPTRTGSRSTPAAVIPARANASRSPPIPQPRSTAERVSAAWSRPARWVATLSRVACSRPSGVKYMRAARSPNFATARRRSSAWVRAAATRSADVERRSRAWTASSSCVGVRGRLDGPGEHGLALVGQQPPEGVEVHARQSGSHRAGLPAHPGTRTGGVLTSALALST